LSTKINATVDALGNPTGFTLTPGQACDLDGADILLPRIKADILIGDKGFDADERVIVPLEQAGKIVVIPPKANRKQPRPYDKELYKARHLIENFFARLKQFRAIATRYDKRAINFLAGVYLASTMTGACPQKSVISIVSISKLSGHYLRNFTSIQVNTPSSSACRRATCRLIPEKLAQIAVPSPGHLRFVSVGFAHCTERS
jgi:transposase